MAAYKQHRLGEDSDPIVLGFGGVTITGYFVGNSVTLQSAEQGAYAFSFKFLGKWDFQAL